MAQAREAQEGACALTEKTNLIDFEKEAETSPSPFPPPLSPSVPLTRDVSMASISFQSEAPQSSKDFDPCKRWDSIFQEALRDGDLIGMAFPVTVRNNGPNEYNVFQWDLIKELRKIVTTYGLHAPFTQSLLENVMTGQLLVPYDCRQIAAMILTPTQKLLWEKKWRELCEIVALQNLERTLGDPLMGAGLPQFMGTEPLIDPRLQAWLNDAILRQSAQLALQALLKLPEAERSQPSFTSIR